MKVSQIGEKPLSEIFNLFKEFKCDVSGESYEKGELITLKLKAKPGAKVEKLHVNEYGELEVFIKARPVEGAANKALMKALGNSFGIAPSHVELTKGEKSKVKYFTLNFSFSRKDLIYFKGKISKALDI